MLAACEHCARHAALPQMSLHVRLADPAARKLYESAGFEEVQRDSFAVQFSRGYRPRSLLVKQLS